MESKTPMFGKDEQVKHFGPELQLSKRLNPLRDVERHFFAACAKRRVETSYDITAEERPYFQTLNYTNYAGLFIVHPLQTELSLRQMYDALRDNQQPCSADFYGFLLEALKAKASNKYETERPETNHFASAVVVLPGSNRIKTHVCLNKVKWVYEKHDRDVIFKPHPITQDSIIQEFSEKAGIPLDVIADKKEDLYALIENADTVYTTHISESAAYSAILGKKISPIDPIQTRFYSSFAHLNYFFFSEPEPETWINTMFGSYKSGVFHPDIDKDWKHKIELYLDYILELRDRYKDAYIYSR